MLATLMLNPVIEQYLKSFPHSQWTRCLELTMVLGIQAAQKKFPYGVTLETLSRLISKKEFSAEPRDSRKLREDKLAGEAVRSSKGKIREKQSTLEGKKPVIDFDAKPRKSPIALDLTRPRRSPNISVGKLNAGTRSKPFLDDDLDYAETRIKPASPVPVKVRSAGKKPPSSPPTTHVHAKPLPEYTYSYKSLNSSSFLTEPKTNKAFVPRVMSGMEARGDLENSLLRITDEFLADPFMSTLTTPKMFTSLDQW